MNHLRAQWREAAQVKVTPGRSPLPYDRYNITHRISLIEGSGYAPGIDAGKQKMEEAAARWKAGNPGKRLPKDFKDPARWTPVGYTYFTPDNSEPGTIGFVDVEAYNDAVFLAYLAVRPDHRGRGMARTLIQAVYDQFPKAKVDWGKLMQPQMGTLYESFKASHPDRTYGGSRYY